MHLQHNPRRWRIGLFVDTLNHAYQNALLLGAHRALEEAGADLYCLAGGGLRLTDASNHSRNSLYDLVRSNDLDGYIVSATMTNALAPDEIGAYCAAFAPAPVCFVGARVAGIPSVLLESTAGVRDLTSHLIRVHKRRRILFLGGPELSAESQDRHAGYRQAHEENGLPLSSELLVHGDFLASSAHDAIRQVFDEQRIVCDAIVAANDLMAIGAMEALDARGIRVPEEVSIVGFDDSEEARFTTPPLTTINQQVEAQSATAATFLLSRLALKKTQAIAPLQTMVVLRQSCGCHHTRVTRKETPFLDDAEVETHRAAMKSALLAVAPGNITEEVPEWRERLVQAIFSDTEGRSEGAFTRTFDDLLRRTARHGDVNGWHGVVNVLQSHATRSTQSRSEAVDVDGLLHTARQMIGSMAERVQARRRISHERTLHRLQELSASLRTSFDEASLRDIITRRLPDLGVPSFFIAQKDVGAPSPDSAARLLVAYRADSGLLESGTDKRYRAGDIVPKDLVPRHRHTMVVEPLFFGDELLGFGAFELGPLESFLYEEFREHISNALKGIRLFQQLVEEATRRQQAEKDRLEGELRLATRIQNAILPKSRQVAGLDIHATMVPATEVGGDYFDILPFEGGAWICIGDVVGHGLPAGLLMLMLQSLVAATVRSRPEATPSEVWRTVNAVLCENIQERLEQDEYATLTILRYDVTGLLTFAGAHEDILVVRAHSGECELVETPGTWAGLASRPKDPVPEASCKLEPDDVLVLYTDGITEAMNSAKIVFGQDQLCHTLERVHHKSAHEICVHVMQTVQCWGARQVDDQTLLVAKFLGPGH